MSGRLAALKRRNYRAAARVAFVALCGLACGLLVSPGAEVGAQPRQPTQPGDAKKVDQKSPLAADTPGRKAHAEFAVPDLDRKIFADIDDFKPVASEDKNPGEYAAWCEVVSHAKKFAAADLERHAARDLTVVELVRVRDAVDPNDPTRPRRSPYRGDLLRFDGQLMYVRRLEAPLFFRNNPELGVKELYEARLVPVDESPLMPVSIVFLQLPEALAAVKDEPLVPEKGASEWVEAKQYVSAAGYYFKTMNVPGARANAVVGVPVLIGKSITLLPGPPAPPGSDPTVIEPMRIFDFIKDEAPVIQAAPTDLQWPEVAAQNRVLIHANRFSAEKLEEHANRDVKFADLFLDVRTAFKLKLVRFEGRLISLRSIGSNDDLRAAGVENVFEGWLVPLNEPRGNPVCILFTEPLAGVEPNPKNGLLNKWVSFAGYSFKKMRYESGEQDAKNPARNVHKYAPLLIGKSPIPRPDPDGVPAVTWSSFVLWAIVGGAALIGAAGVLTWYYRGGDKQAKEAMNTARGRNPFDANGANNTNGGPPPA